MARTETKRTGSPMCYVSTTLVDIERGVFSEDHIEGADPDRPVDFWITRTRLERGRWFIDIEHQGKQITLPHEVVEVLVDRQRAGIQRLEAEDKTTERSARGRVQMADRMANGYVPTFGELNAAVADDLRDEQDAAEGAAAFDQMEAKHGD